MKYSGKTVYKKQHYTFAEIMMVVTIFIIILAMIMAAWMSSGHKAQLDNAARIVSANQKKDGELMNTNNSQNHNNKSPNKIRKNS